MHGLRSAHSLRSLLACHRSRIMKRVLPDQAKMSKESKASIQESVSEFIGFITSEASDRLSEDKRKTITGDDIIEGMRALGFDNYVEFLTIYLKKYRMSVKPTTTGTGSATAGGGSAGSGKGAGGGGGGMGGGSGDKKRKAAGRDAEEEDESEDDDDDEDEDDDDDGSDDDRKPNKRRRE